MVHHEPKTAIAWTARRRGQYQPTSGVICCHTPGERGYANPLRSVPEVALRIRLQNDVDRDSSPRISHGSGLSISFDASEPKGDRAASIKEVAPPFLLVRELDPDGHFVELFNQLDRMSDERQGYFDPRSWHEFRPQHPRVWTAADRRRGGMAPPRPEGFFA